MPYIMPDLQGQEQTMIQKVGRDLLSNNTNEVLSSGINIDIFKFL